jgi:hydrogenase maturation protease
MPDSSHGRDFLLVIGYGNSVRQDDQAGPMVAERIEMEAMPGVRTLVCAQLSPEHAEAVSLASAVVFVDAQADPAAGVCFVPVFPGESSQVTTHAVEPRTLLALARDVFGQVPSAWWLTIPAERLGFGTDLSVRTQEGIEQAVLKVIEWAESHARPVDPP